MYCDDDDVSLWTTAEDDVAQDDSDYHYETYSYCAVMGHESQLDKHELYCNYIIPGERGVVIARHTQGLHRELLWCCWVIKEVLLLLGRRRRFWSGGALGNEFVRESH